MDERVVMKESINHVEKKTWREVRKLGKLVWCGMRGFALRGFEGGSHASVRFEFHLSLGWWIA